MKVLLSVILSLTALVSISGEDLYLGWKPQGHHKQTEGIMIWVKEDGTFLADSGPITTERLVDVFKEWRSEGVEPGVVIILHTKLQSNRDLLTVYPLLCELKKNLVPFRIAIYPQADAPPKDLLTPRKA